MLFGNRPADKTAKWRVSTRSFAVLLAYTLFIWWLEVLDLLAWLLHVPQGTVLSRAAALVLCGAVMVAIGRFERDHAGVSPLFSGKFVHPGILFGQGICPGSEL